MVLLGWKPDKSRVINLTRLCVCIEARWDRFVLNGSETVLFVRFPVTFDSCTLICGFPCVQLTNARVTIISEIQIIFILQRYSGYTVLCGWHKSCVRWPTISNTYNLSWRTGINIMIVFILFVCVWVYIISTQTT